MGLTWLAIDQSSHVTAIGRDEVTKDVGVRFHDGSEYVYYNVSSEDWEELLDHPSKGRFVNITLRREYRYEKIR